MSQLQQDQEAVSADIIHAAAAGDVGELKRIWSSADRSARDMYGRQFAVWSDDAEEYCVTTALHQAVVAGSSDCIEWLLQQEAEIDLVDVHGRSALAVAALCGDVHLVRLLIDAGASINGGARTCPNCHENQVGIPLHNAAETNTACMHALLELGASETHIEEAGDCVVAAACRPRASVEPVSSLVQGRQLQPVQLHDSALPRIVCALEAMTAALASAPPHEPGAPHPLDRFLGGPNSNGFPCGVQAALALLPQGTDCPGAWPRMVRDDPAWAAEEHAVPTPLLAHTSPYADLLRRDTVLRVLQYTLDDNSGHWTYNAKAVECLQRGYSQAENNIAAVLTWAIRCRPIARLAQGFGLTRAPLYPCESQTQPFVAHDAPGWCSLPPWVLVATDRFGNTQQDEGALGTADVWDRLMDPWSMSLCKVAQLNATTLLGSVVCAIPLLLIAKHGSVHSTEPGQDATSRFLRMLRGGATAATWPSHVRCMSAQDAWRCCVCFAAVVRHVCAVDVGLLREVQCRGVLRGLLQWGWNARRRRSMVLWRVATRGVNA